MNRLGPVFLALLAPLFSPLLLASDADQPSNYLYQDNRELVALVHDAAALIEQRGTQAFNTLAIKGSRWLDEERYLFVYDDQGTVLFHPIEPELEGQNLAHLEDMEGRPIVAHLLEIGRRPEPDASGWLFYLWEGPWHAKPQWKASFVRKAISPDGRVLLVGSGIYDIKIEKTFVKDSVDQAAVLIRTQGREAAFAELGDISCPLHVLDSYIQVTDEEGNVLVDPLFPNLKKKRNISQVVDLIGKNAFQDTKTALQHSEATWTRFTEPKPGSGLPEKRLIYTRKVSAGDETFYVSASYVPASPIWLK